MFQHDPNNALFLAFQELEARIPAMIEQKVREVKVLQGIKQIQGEPGPPGKNIKGEPGRPGKDITGPPGKDAETPIKGEDYFTDKDKEEFVKDIIKFITANTTEPLSKKFTKQFTSLIEKKISEVERRLTEMISKASRRLGGRGQYLHGGGLDVKNIITGEQMGGVVNQVNLVFTIAYKPVEGTVQVFLNGMMMSIENGDYEISGKTITFTSLKDGVPQAPVGFLMANYIKQSGQ